MRSEAKQMCKRGGHDRNQDKKARVDAIMEAHRTERTDPVPQPTAGRRRAWEGSEYGSDMFARPDKMSRLDGPLLSVITL